MLATLQRGAENFRDEPKAFDQRRRPAPRHAGTVDHERAHHPSGHRRRHAQQCSPPGLVHLLPQSLRLRRKILWLRDGHHFAARKAQGQPVVERGGLFGCEGHDPSEVLRPDDCSRFAELGEPAGIGAGGLHEVLQPAGNGGVELVEGDARQLARERDREFGDSLEFGFGKRAR